MAAARDGMNDHRQITMSKLPWRRFLPRDALAMHRASRAWLSRALAAPFDGPTVVVTHHAPSPLSLGGRRSPGSLDPCYASRLDALVAGSGAALWIENTGAPAVTLYPAKDRKGLYTGVWVVDSSSAGTFDRLRTRCFREAQRAERHVRRGNPLRTFKRHEPPQADSPGPDGPYTLASLAVEAARRFDGRKNAGQSAQRLAAVTNLLGPEMDIRTLRLRHLEHAASDLRAGGKSPATINRYLAAISGAMKWAYRNELVEKQPPVPWEPEGQGRIAFVPAGADTKLVSWMLANGRDRQALLYEVLVSTGLRMGELQSLTPQAIQGEWVRLSDTKNGDCRDVPIAPELGKLLRVMLVAGTLPSRRTIAETFVAAGEAVGLEVRMTPHVLRHTAATRLNDAGVPTATIKEFLGHRSIRTTLLYAHVTKASLQEASRLLRAREAPMTPQGGDDGQEEPE